MSDRECVIRIEIEEYQIDDLIWLKENAVPRQLVRKLNVILDEFGEERNSYSSRPHQPTQHFSFLFF